MSELKSSMAQSVMLLRGRNLKSSPNRLVLKENKETASQVDGSTFRESNFEVRDWFLLAHTKN